MDVLHEKLPPALRKQLISQASLLQRGGRAGRCMEGFDLVMALQDVVGSLSEFRTPEAQRVPLHTVALFALGHGLIDDAACLEDIMRKLPSPPPLRNVRQAAEKLELLELTAGGARTLLGENPSAAF